MEASWYVVFKMKPTRKAVGFRITCFFIEKDAAYSIKMMNPKPSCKENCFLEILAP
jgi:hypothetical protein